jgi:hypothetical protein
MLSKKAETDASEIPASDNFEKGKSLSDYAEVKKVVMTEAKSEVVRFGKGSGK